MMAKKKRSAAKSKPKSRLPEKLIPTGCSTLNCALSDNPYGGYRKGTIVNAVGDSSAGKSILAFTTFAASNAEGLHDYRFIFDDAECGASFNTEALFGEETAERIEPPSRDTNGDEQSSDTIEDFQMHIDKALRGGQPFIYVLDSFDGLTSEADRKKAKEQIKQKEKGNEETSGSYGQAKTIKTNEILREIKGKLKKTNSLLIIVSQVRENLDAKSFTKKRRAGGMALKHYSWQEFWLHLGAKITATKNDKKMMIGVNTIADITKNRETGKQRQAKFPIYYDLGIDDVNAGVEFLVDNGHWNKKKQSVVASEFDLECSQAKLVEHIEKNNLESELQKVVGQCWNEIEDSLKLKNRKKRFS